MNQSSSSSSRSGEQSVSGGGPLTCPRCAISHPLSERFCSNCGMPLVYKGRRDEEPITDAQGRARKVNPAYARGEPVKVAFARNQAEAELIQGMLLEEGIPSIQRRTRGFDVPDFLSAGPRDVLVPETGAESARSMLENVETQAEGEERAEVAEEEARSISGPTTPARLLIWVLVGLGVAFASVYLMWIATG